MFIKTDEALILRLKTISLHDSECEMILCVSLNPAVDKMLKLNSINIGKVNRASLESVHAGGKG